MKNAHGSGGGRDRLMKREEEEAGTDEEVGAGGGRDRLMKREEEEAGTDEEVGAGGGVCGREREE